ncbi:sce7726 family protein [Alteromonas halophila]|uniref:Sce7726 family protein n=1 Tax=Alteromonas halophila TaxID=516698 RepID=A0A918JBD6_9ALTE|nr:sce7726 family protein [Alteromonas halophila]GGW72570.1 hypothetical protein GCM10007391_00010 [Alteromonas halophila]
MNLSQDYNISAISRLFSSSVVKELARKGKSPLFARLISEAGGISQKSHGNVADAFEDAFSILKKKDNRHEYVYKSALTQNVLLGRHSLNTASMLTEFRVGDCKADVVILNGTGTVYEIKSERDSLTRLTKQVSAYRNVFAKVYVITGENHLDAVLNSVPEDVGINVLTSGHNISEVRRAQELPERTCSSAIFDSLRINEAKLILNKASVECPDVPNTEQYAVYKEAFSKLSSTEAHKGLVEVLKKTRSLLPLKQVVDNLPLSLRSAALTTPIRKSDQQRLIDAVNTPLDEALQWM